MATLRSDVIIPEVFESYVNEETTKKDAFLASGVVQPMAQLNASEDGGDFVNVPFWNANDGAPAGTCRLAPSGRP